MAAQLLLWSKLTDTRASGHAGAAAHHTSSELLLVACSPAAAATRTHSARVRARAPGTSHDEVVFSESEPQDPVAPRGGHGWGRGRARALRVGAVARGRRRVERRLVRQRRGELRAHRGRRQVQVGGLRAPGPAGVRAVPLRRQVAARRGAAVRVVPVRLRPLPAAREPHRHVAQEAPPARVPRRRAPARPRLRRRGCRRRRHHVRLPAQAAPGREHGGRRRRAAAGPGGTRRAAAGPGHARRRHDTGVRARRRIRGAAARRPPRAAPRPRVPQGGHLRRRGQQVRRRRGGRQGGQAGGRVPGRGGARGRPAARRVRGARTRRPRARAARRRRALPRRRHLPQGTSKHEQRREEVAVQADRRAQAHGGGRGTRRPERPHAGALRDAGALLGARQAQPPRRAERLLQRSAEPQPGAGAPRPVPLQARGPRPAPGGAPSPRGRRQAPDAVQRSSGPGGQADLREEAARRRRLLQVEHVLVRRRHGRRRREGRRLRERYGAADAAEGEEGQHHHGDAQRKVAQVNVLRGAEISLMKINGLLILCLLLFWLHCYGYISKFEIFLPLLSSGKRVISPR